MGTSKTPIDGYYESLFVELTSKCHPRNFMQPYDHQKVKIANEIYSEVLQSENDIDRQKTLRLKAIEELGIRFSTRAVYQKLLEKVNPQRFMEDYDAEKVALSNDFYQRIKDNADDIIELEDIMEEIEMSPLAESINKQQNGYYKKESYSPIIILLIIILALLLGFVVLSVSTTTTTSSNDSYSILDSVPAGVSNQIDDNTYKMEYPEYGFYLKSPCPMNDVSNQSSGDFLINIGGITDGNDPVKMAAYQMIVTLVPVGYLDLPEKEYKQTVMGLLKKQAQRYKSYKQIMFGYEGYPGFVVETEKDGYEQKGAIFVKDNLVIALTVISNNNLNSKFNNFTNGFKSMK